MEQPKPTLPEDIEAESGNTDIKQLTGKAIDILYDEQFNNVKKSIENTQPEQLPEKIAFFISNTLLKIDAEQKTDLQTITQVGLKLIQHFIEDFIADGIIEELTGEQAMAAMGLTMRSFAQGKGIPEEQVDELIKQLQSHDMKKPGLLDNEQQPQQQNQSQGLLQGAM